MRYHVESYSAQKQAWIIAGTRRALADAREFADRVSDSGRRFPVRIREWNPYAGTMESV